MKTKPTRQNRIGFKHFVNLILVNGKLDFSRVLLMLEID